MPSGFQSQTSNGSPTPISIKVRIFVHIRLIVRRGSAVILRAMASCVPRECGDCVAVGPPPSLGRAGTASHDFPITPEYVSACLEPPRSRLLSAPAARGAGGGRPVGERAREHPTHMGAHSPTLHLSYTQWGAGARSQCEWGETGHPPPAISPPPPLAYAVGGEGGMRSDSPWPTTPGTSSVGKRGGAQPPPHGWCTATGARGAQSHRRTSRDGGGRGALPQPHGFPTRATPRGGGWPVSRALVPWPFLPSQVHPPLHP